jgi:hypothetical protein
MKPYAVRITVDTALNEDFIQGRPLEEVKENFLTFLHENSADLEDILGMEFEAVEL